MNVFTRMFAGVRRRSPAVALRVTDTEGRVLADVANAARGDYLLSVTLLSGLVTVDC